MPPISEAHEKRKKLMGHLIETWCIEKEIELIPTGSAPLKLLKEAGGEPDESYHIGEEKDRPDLVIEVALTSGGLSKRAFYASFEIPEIWIWRNETLEVHSFDKASSGYERCEASRVLEGIDIAAIQACSTLPSLNQAVREFRRMSKV